MTSLDDAVLVGVMSGTSMDGVTAAIARFRKVERGFDAQLLGVETVAYSDAIRARLSAALTGATPAEYTALDFELGTLLADAAVRVIDSAGVARAEIAAVASHGHTIWHEPPRGTWQIGDGAVIAERTTLPVIEDFRVRDVAAGGQGAPLVPMADSMLFGHDSKPRALLNIGGIANVTVVPRRGETAGVRAFDTGPGVALIDTLAAKLLRQRYDDGGRVARSGRVIESVVETLLAHEYFRREPPKSTGRELFSETYATQLADACHAASPNCSDADILATASELTARSIALAFDRFVPEPLVDVLVSGGGARNDDLMTRLHRQFSSINHQASVALFETLFFHGEGKEAVAFALLGLLHLRGEAGNIPSATGASGLRILGKRVPA